MSGPRVSFYSLAEDAQGDRFQLACRLAERIYAEGLRLFIRTAAEPEARHLDRLLWTFRDQSFVPHGIAGETDAELTPVLIGYGEPAADDGRPVLINLAPAVPGRLDDLARLCEVVDHDPEVRAAARERYRHYRSLGLTLDHHQIRP